MTQRVLRKDAAALCCIFEQMPCHASLQEAGQDAVGPDASRSVFGRQTLSETDDPSFGCGIVCLARRAAQSAVGADVNDVTGALFDHEF